MVRLIKFQVHQGYLFFKWLKFQSITANPKLNLTNSKFNKLLILLSAYRYSVSRDIDFYCCLVNSIKLSDSFFDK